MSWMQTYTGGKFFVTEPAKTDFDMRDIAHALSNLCRFGGHTREFYSVAQHSVLVADIVRAKGGSVLEELWGLMHDATEAYMIDIPTPLKLTLEGYEAREHELMELIAGAFKLTPHGEPGLLPTIVKAADRIALVTEARQLTHGTAEWSSSYNEVASFPVKIRSLPPELAKLEFLNRWQDIQRRLRPKR